MLTLLSSVLSVLSFMGSRTGAPTGLSHFQKEAFLQGLTVGQRDKIDLQSDGDIVALGDVTVSGGSLTLTTTNIATSSAIIGCIQSYPTSTATAVRWGMGTIATTSPLAGGGNSTGFVLWQYGTCPR